MAQLLVRNLDEALVDALRIRAARNGHSVEEEHRRILRQILLGEGEAPQFKELLLAMPSGGEDADFARQADRGRDVEL